MENASRQKVVDGCHGRKLWFAVLGLEFEKLDAYLL